MQRVSYTCIDMKYQKPINPIPGGYWYRCKHVEFAGETATWELNSGSRYSLFEAYEKTPHRQLIQADTDVALQAFVKAWGPLRPQLDAWSGSDPIEMYRNERDALTASVRFLTSVAAPEMQRPALLGMSELSRTDTTMQSFLRMLRFNFQIPGEMQSSFDADIHQWLESVEQKQIRAATAYLVSGFTLSLAIPSFTVETIGNRDELKPSLGIHSLTDAIRWMVWQDVFQKHPFQFCVECRKLFQPEYMHKKKYCTDICARRKASREWEQRKRTKEKENVTHKAR
jgi:hypothetical protein